MWVLCLHDSAVRFSGCARNTLYTVTYPEMKVKANIHARSKNDKSKEKYSSNYSRQRFLASNTSIGLRAA